MTWGYTLEGGKWNLENYNKNPELLGVYPLYIITTDGFVLDRRDPIHGFLDISDLKRLLTFDPPQTFTSISNQKRRIYVKKIHSNNTLIGVIAVSYYDPPEEIIERIDKKLVNNTNYIYSKLKIKNGAIDTSEVNIQQIDYDIAFTVIDRFNTIVLKAANVNNTNRIPNFIDPSYVKTQLSHAKEAVIRDAQTGEFFLVLQSPIENKQRSPLGLIIVGQPITPLLEALSKYLIWNSISSLIIATSAIFFIGWLVNAKKLFLVQSSRLPQKIVFSQKRGMLTIDGIDIEVPYATNQFYLLQALFSHPTKRWETDELLERFGEDKGEVNSRKVYDAMVSVNKKVSIIAPFRLIFNQNKTYQLNPTILATK